MVTNQSGVARGFFTEAVVDLVHRQIAGLLEAGGAHIDAYYYCPHHPDGTVARYARACDCRKPSRGLVDRAERELGIDPRRSFAVGDRWIDVALARGVGARGILVRTGYGAAEEMRPQEGLTADAVVNNLVEAAGWIFVEKPEMLIARSVHPLPGDAERKERLLSLVDGFATGASSSSATYWPTSSSTARSRGSSREAPVLDPRVRRHPNVAGGAGNAANNVAALGAAACAGRRRR